MTDRIDGDDLAVVRQVLTVAPDELDASRSRARALLEARLAPPARWTARRWVPMVAAAVVLAVAVGVVAALRRPPAELPGSLETVDVAAAFERLATAASGTVPVTVGAGQVLYLRADGLMSDYDDDPPTRWHYRHEIWADPDGVRPLRSRRYEKRMDVPVLEMREHQFSPTPGRPGVDFTLPSPAMIAALPTDADAMWTALTARTAAVRGDWSVERGIWEGTRQFLSWSDPLLSPAVRAALYRALARLTRLIAVPIEIDGRVVVSFRHTERGQITELLFDEQSGRFLGEGSGTAEAPNVTFRPAVPNLPLERTIEMRLLVTCTVVDRDQIPA